MRKTEAIRDFMIIFAVNFLKLFKINRKLWFDDSWFDPSPFQVMPKNGALEDGFQANPEIFRPDS